MNGLWLEDYGFHKGDKVSIHCEEGKLVIVKSEDE
ncbi:TPA: SymE family type I addiction module toxin [Clostridioides difficile]|nr:SymE family type I addiction module toxin [Clostridioides difficile]MBY2766702.1 type I toxin-antitoxin system SymE family toxin [Clostridioides difficile]HBF2365882.1 SymE family type I addiction module toxin [Clostridioides difficile]HBF5832634.1 SymE family type I addiction module toxin [Clostridioides difficile]HBF6593122.1 SymE family type I addiction module toxin [Clostridioides difficile]